LREAEETLNVAAKKDTSPILSPCKEIKEEEKYNI